MTFLRSAPGNALAATLRQDHLHERVRRLSRRRDFEPWQDHEWPEHCGAPATYLGEIGERELATLAAGSDVEAFLQQHEVFAVDPPITLDMVPPRAPGPGRNVGKHDPPLPLHELRLGDVPLGRQLGHGRQVTFPHWPMQCRQRTA